ncbi:MAG: hypothetical protein FWD89_03685, partial [Firmicutes bacterium]|nr:hypothetical protein [Bacillota bacterium]
MDVKKFIKSIIAATIFFGVALGLIIWFSTHNSEVAIFIIPLSLVFLGFVANKVFASLKQKELVNGVTIKTPINFVTIAFGLVFIFAGILIIVLAQDTSSILFGVGGIVGGVVIGAWGYMASRNKIVIEETGFTRYHLFGFKHETYAFSEVTSVTNMKGIMFLNAKTKEKKKDWQFEIVGA